MSKRTPGLKRRPRDMYPTIDPRAVRALVPHLRPGTAFIEPCAGAGHLVDALVAAGMVLWHATDIVSGREDIGWLDAFDIIRIPDGVEVITNPPWSRPILHRLIAHFGKMGPTWFLFDADWMHTAQAVAFEPLLTDIVSVGRLRWLEEGEEGDKGSDPFDNCAWYRFGPDKYGATRFWPRAKSTGEDVAPAHQVEESA